MASVTPFSYCGQPDPTVATTTLTVEMTVQNNNSLSSGWMALKIQYIAVKWQLYLLSKSGVGWPI